MPHLVSNFLRSSSLPGIKNPAGSRSRTTSRAASRSTSRNPSPHAIAATASASHHDDHAVKMPELIEALKKHHRLSLPFGRPSKEHHHLPHLLHHRQSPQPATIDWTLESPAIVLHGTPEESTGALVTGQLTLRVNSDVLDIERFSASLSLVVTHKRPLHGNCTDCQTHTTLLEQREFLAYPTALSNGRHDFPFSVLIAGNLPASTETPIVSISYVLKAEAASSPAISFTRTLDVRRSLPEPLYPHNSVRVFPPTNIKAAASYTSTVDAAASNRMTLKLDGLLTHNNRFGTVDLWKLKRLTWRLEETVTAVAPTCERHNPGPADATRSHTRVIAEKSLHEGWKSDYTGNDGTLDMELDYSAAASKYACDVKMDNGTVVSHSLCLELVVSKEYAQEGKTHISHQTGTGRILRMHFAVILTHNAGAGISWDNESPPVYEDVPPSPPGYQFDEDPIEYHDVEELHAGVTAPSSRRPSQSE